MYGQSAVEKDYQPKMFELFLWNFRIHGVGGVLAPVRKAHK
jgi:hypothetical protein